MDNVSLEIETAVPANRLGQLLAEARLRNGTDLQVLASAGGFTVGELSDLEAGHRLLDDDLIQRVTDLYEIDCGPIVPQRSGLVIDLNEQLMYAAPHYLPLDSKSRDHVLDRYLSLVYLLRNNPPGQKVTLRDEDVDILAASLAERRELIEEQLLRAMDPGNTAVEGLFSWFKKRLWVPAAGALVGVTSVGALVLLSNSSDADAVATQELLTAAANNASPEPERSGPPVSRPASVIASEAVSITPESQAIGDQAEALLPFDWGELVPGWQINYRGPNSAFRGLTYPYDKTIDIFIRDSDSPELVASILAHEIGHAVDVDHLSSDQRRAWQAVRGIEDSPWWADAFASDFESGAGDFAEAFATWALDDPSSSEIAGQPTQEQLDVISGFVADIP